MALSTAPRNTRKEAAPDFLIARSLGRSYSLMSQKQRDLGVHQMIRHSVASGSFPVTTAFIAAGGNRPPRVHAAIITARTSSGSGS